MNENVEVVETELAMPGETADSDVDMDVQTISAQEPDATAETQSEQTLATEEAAAIPPTETDDAPAQPAEEATAITIPVRFNHQERQLTVEEAGNYAEMGLAYEQLKPTIRQLRMLAAGSGRTVEEMVTNLMEANDRMLHDRFLEETGGNQKAADILLEDAKRKREEAYHAGKQQQDAAAQAKRQELTDRLAAEFIELQAEFPELDSVDKVPAAVLNTAAKGTHMLDAYLRYKLQQERRVAQNRTQQQQAASASVGSRADNTTVHQEDSVIAALMDGVRAGM